MFKRLLLPLLFIAATPAWSACPPYPVVLVEITTQTDNVDVLSRDFMIPIGREASKILEGLSTVQSSTRDSRMRFEFAFGARAATGADKAQVEAAFNSLRRMLPYTREPIRFSIGPPKDAQECAAKPKA